MSRPSDLRAELAVINVFRTCRAGAGDALHMAQFVAAWPDYGLRETDLPLAVARLGLRGLVRRDQHALSDALVLTAAGEQWSAEQPAWLEYQLLGRRSEQTRFLRARRDMAPSRARRGRRAWERANGVAALD